jgi:hypothetical protein
MLKGLGEIEWFLNARGSRCGQLVGFYGRSYLLEKSFLYCERFFTTWHAVCYGSYSRIENSLK